MLWMKIMLPHEFFSWFMWSSTPCQKSLKIVQIFSICLKFVLYFTNLTIVCLNVSTYSVFDRVLNLCSCTCMFAGGGGVDTMPGIKTNIDVILPSTHRVHKTWTFLIITHNSWYRSRKIKEDSSTEREKFPLRFEPIFITVQCTSQSQDFSNEKWSRNLQIGNAFNDWNSTISHANWQCLTNKSYNFYIFSIVMHYTSFGSAIKRN